MRKTKILVSSLIIGMSLLLSTNVSAKGVNNTLVYNTITNQNSKINNQWGEINIGNAEDVNNLLNLISESTSDETFLNTVKSLSTDLKTELKSIKYDITNEAVIIEFIGSKTSTLQEGGVIALSHINKSGTNSLGFSDMNNFSTNAMNLAFVDGIKIFSNANYDKISDDIKIIKSNIITVGLQNYTQMKEYATNKQNKVFTVNNKETSYGDWGYVIKTVDGKVNWYIVITEKENN